MERRELLKGAVAGAFTLWALPSMRGQQSAVTVVDAAGCNTVACQTAEGLVMVDSGPLKYAAAAPRVQALFNTHYHLDQTGQQ